MTPRLFVGIFIWAAVFVASQTGTQAQTLSDAIQNCRVVVAERVFDDGGRYEGQFCNGKQHGIGNYTLPNGYEYSGEWFEGEIQGQGRARFDDGSIYEGSFLAGKPDGFGKITFADGGTYEGEWSNGEINGRGVANYPNGVVYEGEFQSATHHGVGRMVSPNGYVYEGDWVSGVKQGDAVITYPDGSTYEGSMANDVFSGTGVLVWADGRSYNGEWFEGVSNGVGRVISADGQIALEGAFKNNEYLGPLSDPEVAEAVRYISCLSKPISADDLLVCGLESQPLETGSFRTVTDPDTGCQIQTPSQIATSIRWQGKCEEGLVSGTGVLEWYQNEELVWIDTLEEASPLFLKDGKFTIRVYPEELSVSVENCGVFGHERTVNIGISFPKVNIALASNSFTNFLLLKGLYAGLAQCPVEGITDQNTTLNIRHLRSGSVIVSARTGYAEPPIWALYNNPLYDSRAQQVYAQNEKMRQERQAIVQEQRRQAAQIQAEQILSTSTAQYNAIVQQSRAFIETGRGSYIDVVDALNVDLISTLERLENGVDLTFPAPNEIRTINQGGRQQQAAIFGSRSKLSDVALRFASSARENQGFSWQQHMEGTPNPFTPRFSRLQVVCLYDRISQIPKTQSVIDATLEAFDQSNGVVMLTCH